MEPQSHYDAKGFSIAELLVAVAIIGLIGAMSLPSLLGYWQASNLRGGAQQLMSVLNEARALAISQNVNVCVARNGAKVRFVLNGCTGTVWTGASTDLNGWMALDNGVSIAATTADVVFTTLGGATPAGTYTVQNAADRRTITVTVAAAGRVTIP